MEPSQNTSFGQCRCCLSNGIHRDIMKEYYYNGNLEVYFDIFIDCFNLFLSTDANLSTLICTPCVDRLRAASSFRTMVAKAERQLLDSLRNSDDKAMVFVRVPVADTLSDANVKQERDEQRVAVKEEGSDMDDTDLDPDFAPDDVSDAEDLAPLAALRSSEPGERPKPGKRDPRPGERDPRPGGCPAPGERDPVPGERALLARGAPARLHTRLALYKSCEGFVRHLELLKGMVISSSSIAQLLEDDLRRTKQASKVFITEKLAHIINASTLLMYSNITPFKSRSRNGFPCFYCRNLFENIDKLREHTLHHKKSELKKVLSTYGAECLVVYADITDLHCTLCPTPITSLNELKSHLIKIHKKKMYLDHNDRVIPFKLTHNNVYECQICGFTFETFGSIERHMNVHFRNYVCKDCGTGFVTKYRLKVHVKSMHAGGNFPCEVCKKVFNTQQKHKNHVDTVHKNVKRFKCTKCPERFSEYFRRQKHMVEQHGVAPLHYKCNVCDKSFDRRYTLSRHLKRDHLEERDFQCHLCSYKSFTNNELRVHMIKHDGERIYECSVCKKSYARKKTLKEHMRIHNNDRRFVCAVCGQAFVQKCSLKGHLKTHHHTYVHTMQ